MPLNCKMAFILLFLALAAYGQQLTVAVLPSDSDVLSNDELEALTDKMRESVLKILSDEYILLKQDVVIKRLGGAENYIKECSESSCIVDLGKKAQVDYVSQASVGKLGNKLRLKIELYKVSTGGLLGMYNEYFNNFFSLLNATDKHIPDVFKKITSTPETQKPTPPPVATTTPPTPPAPVTPQELKPTPPQKRYSPPPPPIPKDVPPEEPEPVASATPIHGNSYIGGNSYKNFTTGQRWGTYALNLTINGLGSLVVMGDVFGAAVHFGFGMGAFGMGALTFAYAENKGTATAGLVISAFSFVLGGFWNIYRSCSYDKPRRVANGKYEGFNVAVLPNRRGEFMPYVFYNKGF